jgi:branched-chain amino acid transport system substrate-binding protein
MNGPFDPAPDTIGIPAAPDQLDDTERVVSAMESLRVATPIGPILFRPFDHQSTMGPWVGTTKLDPVRGVGIMTGWEYVPGEKVLPSEGEVRRMREAAK